MAQVLNIETMEFEDAVLLDEDIKKEYENEKEKTIQKWFGF